MIKYFLSSSFFLLSSIASAQTCIENGAPPTNRKIQSVTISASAGKASASSLNRLERVLTSLSDQNNFDTVSLTIKSVGAKRQSFISNLQGNELSLWMQSSLLSSDLSEVTIAGYQSGALRKELGNSLNLPTIVTNGIPNFDPTITDPPKPGYPFEPSIPSLIPPRTIPPVIPDPPKPESPAPSPVEPLPDISPTLPNGMPMDGIDVIPMSIPNSGQVPQIPTVEGRGATGIQPIEKVNVIRPEDIPRAKLISDINVLISYKKVGGAHFSYCNGAHLGEGKILTNRHCFPAGATDYIAWFGDIEWNSNYLLGPKKSEFACHATYDGEFEKKSPRNPKNKLDVAQLLVTYGELKEQPRFAKSIIELPTMDPWCNLGSCNNDLLVELNTDLNVAQVWTIPSDGQVKDEVINYEVGLKTLSNNTDPTNICGAKANPNSQSYKHKKACGKEETHPEFIPKTSNYGFMHNCDTSPGASGAPIFKQSDVNNFIKNKTNKLALAGVHRSGKRNVANCAVPASLTK